MKGKQAASQARSVLVTMTTTTTMMPQRRRLLIILALTSSLASTAFHANAPQTGTAASIAPTANEDYCCNRRSILQEATTSCWKIATCATSIIAAATANPAFADVNVIRSPGKCANGEGEGCDSLADNNELIRSLQKKSAANRESNQRVCRCTS